MSYNILVVIDGSDQSLRAVREAAEIAKGISDATIRLLYVYPVQLTSHSNHSNKDYQTVVTSISEAALASPVSYLKSHGLAYEKTIRVGNLIQEIHLNIRMYDCQMVVLSQSNDPEHSVIIDSVIKKASCPILIVPKNNQSKSLNYI